MAKFRKLPVEIEAVQLRWDNWSEMCEFARVGKLAEGQPEGGFSPAGVPHLYATGTDTEMALAIPTLEGVMIARLNDWVIRGVQGELYSCKPDIFAATYEGVPTSS